jgi:hypothetical protein
VQWGGGAWVPYPITKPTPWKKVNYYIRLSKGGDCLNIISKYAN